MNLSFWQIAYLVALRSRLETYGHASATKVCNFAEEVADRALRDSNKPLPADGKEDN